MLANLSPLLALLQESAPAAAADDTMVKVICGVGAAILLGIVVLRRKTRKKHQEDQF